MADTLLRRLARFTAELQRSDLPPTVVERVRLQHLSAAGCVKQLRSTGLAKRLDRTTSSRGRATKITGGHASPRDALRLHSTLISAWGWDDQLFMGPVSAGGVTAAWALAKGHTVDEVLVATAAANEVAGRLGAAMLIGPDPSESMGEVHALAAATAAGKLSGLDETTMAHAMALAVSAPARIPLGVLMGDGPGRGHATAQSVAHGFESVVLAKKGIRGQLDALEAPGGVLDQGAWIPLRAAFSGLGTAWLSQTLAYKQLPAPMVWQAPLQAAREVFRRHLKAADKRLRADQVSAVEIALPGPALALALQAAGRPASTPWALPWRLPSAVGVLLVDHSLDGRTHDPELWASIRDRVGLVASKLTLTHDWDLTMGLAAHTVEIWAPLLAGLTRAELQRALGSFRSMHLQTAGPGAKDLLAIARARPDQLLTRIQYASGDLSDVRMDEWKYCMGAKVRVHTIRGGAWPEEREIPESSPGWSWGQTRSEVFAKHAGEGGDDSASAALLVQAGSEEAGAWVGSLLR
jgi:2-methylcitrate dehydratase PrpD